MTHTDRSYPGRLHPARLWAEYKTDPAAADAKYYGKTYLFKNVVIEDMAMLYKPADAVAYVLNSLVYFRTDNKTRLLDLKVGDVVDITGGHNGAAAELRAGGPLQLYHCGYHQQRHPPGLGHCFRVRGIARRTGEIGR
jgi:hypothetical protein